MDICIQLRLCTYAIPMLLSLLVLACIASKDERDIPSKFGGFTPALLNIKCSPGRVIFFPINAPGMNRFQLLNFGVLGYGLELIYWVVIAIIVSLTLTITLITTLTII